MALVTREINNTGSPLTDVNGAVLASTLIRFTLVNSRSYAAGTFDATTGEPVAPGPYLSTTDDDGLFSVNLWPTSRGLEERFYLVEIAPDSDSVEFPPFKAPLADGIGALPFLTFRLGGDSVSAWEITAFTAHVNDMTIHTPLGIGAMMESTYDPDGDGLIAYDQLSGVAPTLHTHDSDYAPLAKGVTNGDSHDHSGGDGAQITYSSLGGIPSTFTPSAHGNESHSATFVTASQLHDPVTVADSTSIDLTLTGQQISASAIFGTTSGTVCQGNDIRLSDARTPASHSTDSHSDWPAAVSMTEVGYLDGVTSAIQTQLNSKTTNSSAAITGGTINGTPIGGVTPAAGTFTTLTATANSTSAALTVTQTGTGNALVVEDSASPDSTPFVVSADGGGNHRAHRATDRCNRLIPGTLSCRWHYHY